MRSFRPTISDFSTSSERCSTRGHCRCSPGPRISKERGSLAKLALGYGRYLDLGRQIAEAEEVCRHENDPEMRSYAETELAALRGKEETEGEALRDLLYDRKAGATHAAVILEIRAGTGGDEAALLRAISTRCIAGSPNEWAGSSRYSTWKPPSSAGSAKFLSA